MEILTTKQKFILQTANDLIVADIARKHIKYLPHHLYDDIKYLTDNGLLIKNENRYITTQKGALLI